MPCSPIKAPGFTGIVCTRGKPSSSPCAYCGDRSSRLCDYPVTRPKRAYVGDPSPKTTKGTCDAPLCVRCTTSIAGDGDLCREHAPMWGKALEPQVAR